MSSARRRPVVIQVIDGLERTGMSGDAVDLACALDPLTWDASVVIVGDGPARGRVEQRSLPQHQIARATGWSAISALIRMISQFRAVRPDIVHTHLLDGDLLVPFAVLIAGVPAFVSTRRDGARVPWHKAIIAAMVARLVPTTVVSTPEDAPDRGFAECLKLYERLFAGIPRDRRSLPKRPRAWRITALLLRAVLLFLLLYYITQALVTQISQADFGILAVDPLILLASIALLVLYYALFIGGLALLFRANGSPIRYADVFKISFMANLGKYLPGGVWPVAARVAMAPRIQVSRGTAALLSVVESGFSVAGACAVIVLVGLSGLPVPGMPGWVYWAAAAVLLSFFVVMHPRVLGALVSLTAGAGQAAGGLLRMNLSRVVGLVYYYALIWMVSGAAFWTLTASLVGDPGAGLLAYSAYYALGAVVGLLVLFAPGGIGAREGALLLVLSGPLGAPMAAVVSVAARLWSTVTELVMSAVAVAIPYAASSTEATPADGVDS